MSENKGLISSISKKWKLEQIPSKKLEMENKLMEERLHFLKNEFQHDKTKRTAQGGTIWSKGQAGGPVSSYGKSILKSGNEESVLNKLSNRQLKLKVLKDEAIAKIEKSNQNSAKDKRFRCGQCEKGLAFTHCLECGEDYCANCFTDFHMKGALQKHRTQPIFQESARSANSNNSFINKSLNENSFYSNRSETNSANVGQNLTKNYPNNPNSLLNGSYQEDDSFQRAVMEWRNANKNLIPTPVPPTSAATTQSHRDAILDTSGLPFSRENALNTHKDLENYINSNHTLSYAERMLLQKFRRNDLEFELSVDDNKSIDENTKNDMLLRSTANLANSQHINFDKLMDVLNIDSKKVEEKIEHESLDAALNYRIYNSYLSDSPSQAKQSTILIEEINEPVPVVKAKEAEINKIRILKTPKKSEKSEINVFESKKEPPVKRVDTTPIKKEKSDLSTSKSLKKEKTDISLSKSSKQQEKMINLATSESIKKEKTELNLSKSVKKTETDISKTKSIKEDRPLSSSLTKTSEKSIKEISTRKEDFKNIITGGYNGIGEFLMLDVESSGKIEKETIKTSEISLEKESSTLTLKSSTKSAWNPSESLVNKNTNNQNVNDQKSNQKISKIVSSEKKQIETTNAKTNIIEFQLSKKVDDNNNMVKGKSEEKTNAKKDPKNLVSNSLNIRKPIQTPDKFARTKTFVGSVKKESKSQPNKRAYSASYTHGGPSNKTNLEFSYQFLNYDIDDGRSSRICQNEEDESYFGELQVEFEKTVHRLPNKEIVALNDSSTKKNPDSYLSELTKSLEISLKKVNEELDNYGDDDDLESLAMEELKKL